MAPGRKIPWSVKENAHGAVKRIRSDPVPRFDRYLGATACAIENKGLRLRARDQAIEPEVLFFCPEIGSSESCLWDSSSGPPATPSYKELVPWLFLRIMQRKT
jgi:hypothetical protein